LPLSRRRVRQAVGLFWLLDGVLQAQPGFFGPQVWREDIAQAVMGEPPWVRHSIFAAIAVIAAHPALWNALFVAIQLGIGLALLTDRLARPAIVLSALYGFGVWWVGEGFGALPTGFGLLAAGAPGPVVLYPVLCFLAWPRRPGADHDDRPRASDQLPLGRPALVAWGVLWVGGSLLEVPWVYPPGQVLTANLEEASIGSPSWLVHLAAQAGHLVAQAPLATDVLLAIAQVAVGLGVWWRPTRRPALLLALVLAGLFWVFGQDFGGILAPGGSDPSSAPLLALWALALWPPAPASRPTRSRNISSSGPERAPKKGAMAPTTTPAPTPRTPEPAGLSPAAGRRPRGVRLALLPVLAAVALGLAACSSSSSSSKATSSASPAAASSGTSTGTSASSTAPHSFHLVIKNFAFHPADFTVAPGATITVTNEDSVTHTFTARDGAFNTGDIPPGHTVTVTAPTKPGSYPYLCLIHQFMTGVLTVR
jgi:plastocyanin